MTGLGACQGKIHAKFSRDILRGKAAFCQGEKRTLQAGLEGRSEKW